MDPIIEAQLCIVIGKFIAYKYRVVKTRLHFLFFPVFGAHVSGMFPPLPFSAEWKKSAADA